MPHREGGPTAGETLEVPDLAFGRNARTTDLSARAEAAMATVARFGSATKPGAHGDSSLPRATRRHAPLAAGPDLGGSPPGAQAGLHRQAGNPGLTVPRAAGPPAGPGHEPDRGRPGGEVPEPVLGPVLAQVRGAAAGAPGGPAGPAGRPGAPGGAG
ncbi:hypothetical protein [Amycolatopsis sp. DG1A-15b]|uniref:hypothetical protein n=1 Tax=Amycolatopsis sp. DG1A-15b TaxID=3052846 RepID=UPI00255C0472|nr:hypothetical protein [Amycolatopsis sp. DG1A-15b]WIX90707.1 hypothetical protein QRY02_09855 [Amycolatopsis sp. DG1A-15b]